MRYQIYMTLSGLLLIVIGLHARMTEQGFNNYQQRLSTLKAQIAQLDDQILKEHKKIAELSKQKSKLEKEVKDAEDLLIRA